MRTTASLHVHPACVSNRKLIEQLQLSTGCLVVIHAKTCQPSPVDPNGGGHAA
jgi:hypothetical protein